MEKLEEDLIDMGSITEAINNKADRDLNNVNTIALNNIYNYVRDMFGDYLVTIESQIEAIKTTLGITPPVGTIIWYAGATAPTRYLICNGQAVSRTFYVSLFNVIGTLYGAGDGSTTFNVPDLRGRYIKASDTGIGTYNEAATASRTGTTSTNGYHGHAIDGVGNHSHAYTVSAYPVGGVETDGRGAHSHGCQGNGNHNHTVTITDVTEPRNLILLPCIKF